MQNDSNAIELKSQMIQIPNVPSAFDEGSSIQFKLSELQSSTRAVVLATRRPLFKDPCKTRCITQQKEISTDEIGKLKEKEARRRKEKKRKRMF